MLDPTRDLSSPKFDEAPLLVYWEATRACDLACIHCRAEAVLQRHPLELRTDEVKTLLRQIVEFGSAPLPHLVITGGDPLKRPDLLEVIAYARALGLRTSVTPAGTEKLTQQMIQQLKDSGVSSLALSLDGSDAKKHDAFRGVPGSFQCTLAAARYAKTVGIPLQINTMVTASTLDDLPLIYALLRKLEIVRWALFFLIPLGRGRALPGITPERCEKLLNWLCDLAEEAPFPIKSTEAHHFRRVAFLRMKSRGMDDEAILQTPIGRGFGVRDGNGVVFISHIGNIYPSGFLPLSAGNVRRDNLVEIYRHSELMRSLRDVNQLQGKCGCCSFRAICGGSRARAFALTGNPMESDPLCLYRPSCA